MSSVRKYYAFAGVRSSSSAVGPRLYSSTFNGSYYIDRYVGLNYSNLILLDSQAAVDSYINYLKTQYKAPNPTWVFLFSSILILDDKNKIAQENPSHCTLKTNRNNVIELNQRIYEYSLNSGKPMNLLNPPYSYHDLLSTQCQDDKTFHQNITKLFKDYHSNCFWKGHWGRHHISEAKSLVEQIKEKSIEETLDYLSQMRFNLSNIDHNGSFMRRLNHAISTTYRYLELRSSQVLQQKPHANVM